MWEVWLLLLLAFFLGWWAHWFFCCRTSDKTEKDQNSALENTGALSTTAPSTTVEISDNWKPQGFASRPDSVDDLKRIKGIGAVIEDTLNDLGIYQFNQISQWNHDNVTWVENFIAFPGRIGREDWINQAQTLSVGGTTEFANRVDKGEVDY